jgi:lysyl endopeptidase
MSKTPFQILIALTLSVFFSGSLSSQVSKGGLPPSYLNGIKNNIEYTQFTFDEALLKQNLRQGNFKSLKFAHLHECNLDILKKGSKEIIDDMEVWRLGISSLNAQSLYLVFSDFEIPESAKLFIYTPDYAKILGAFTSFNNKVSGRLATVPLPGDSLILEYVVQPNERSETKLQIGQIWHDYIGIVPGTNELKDNRYGLSGDCNIDISCFEGENWEKEKQAVCRIIGGGQICTGSLVNNTKFDARPYFLTANHCINSQSLVDEMVVVFNYESPSCYGPDGSVEQSISGGFLRATTHHFDFSLIELSIPPLPSYNPYFAGWNVKEESASFSTVIHHPLGDVKKISRDFEQTVTANYGGGYDFFSHWLVAEWDLGTTEGGSSGSPLFNEEKQIVGTLTGGEANCDHLLNDYFTKLSMAWNDYPDSTDQLKFWLDPLESGANTLEGYDPYYGQIAPKADYTVNNQQVNASSVVNFVDLSEGNPSEWNWWFSGAIPNHSTAQNPSDIQYTYPGTFDVLLEVTSQHGTNTKLVRDYITVTENCARYSNLGADEAYVSAADYGSWGSLSGHNNYGYTEFAEKYSFITGKFIYGVYIKPSMISSSNGNSVIDIKIWDGAGHPGQTLLTQPISFDDLTPNEWNFIELDQIIYVENSFFIGYKIYYQDQDLFAMAHVPSRGADGVNSTMIAVDDSWSQMNFIDGNNSISLAIEPQICKYTVSINEVKSVMPEIIAYPNPVSDLLNLDIAVPDNTELSIEILNKLGQVLESETHNISGGMHQLNMRKYSSGLYHIKVYNKQFSGSLKVAKY